MGYLILHGIIRYTIPALKLSLMNHGSCIFLVTSQQLWTLVVSENQIDGADARLNAFRLIRVRWIFIVDDF